MNPPADQNLGLIDEADPVGWCVVQAACVHKCLDDRGVPRETGDGTLSLWGRVMWWKVYGG